MRIFIFKSDANPGLQAFSDDQGGGKLPKQFRPGTRSASSAPRRRLRTI